MIGCEKSLSAAASLVIFGALRGFVMGNLSVVSYYYVRKKVRGAKGVFIYLILPLIGAGICFIIWLNLDKSEQMIGGANPALEEPTCSSTQLIFF